MSPRYARARAGSGARAREKSDTATGNSGRAGWAGLGRAGWAGQTGPGGLGRAAGTGRTGPGGRGGLLPRELGDPVVVGRGVSGQAIGQGEDPLCHAQGQRQPAAPGAEVRLLQPDRVVSLEPHVDQPGSLQQLPAVALARQRDRALLGVRPAHVVMAEVTELAVAVILAGKRHAVVPPGEQAAALHQHRGMPGPCTRIPGQLRRALDHLLRYVAVVALERPRLGSLP